MPLLPGKRNIGHNIAVEQAAGKSHKQAVAIALNTARKSGAEMPNYRGMAKRVTNAVAGGSLRPAKGRQLYHRIQDAAQGSAGGASDRAPGRLAQDIAPGRTRGMAVRSAAQAGRLPIINAPLFDDKTQEPGVTGKGQWEEPLAPEGATVGNPPGEFANPEQFYQNQAGKPELTPPHPAPLQESDFPNKDEFTSGTKDNLKSWI